MENGQQVQKKAEKKKEEMLSDRQVARILRQLSILIRAGSLLPDALEEMIGVEGNEDVKPILEVMKQHADNFEDLSQCVKATGVFPEYVTGILEIANDAGDFGDILADLSKYYERNDTLRSEIRSALQYPIIMTVMMVGILIVLLWKIVPIFRSVFEELGMSMNGVASWLSETNGALPVIYVVLLVIAGLFVGLFVFFCYTKKGRSAFDVLVAKSGFTKKISETEQTGRFISAVQLSKRAQMDRIDAVEKCRGLITNESLLKKIDVCLAALREGDTDVGAAVKAGFFDPLDNALLKLSADSDPDAVFDELAKKCDERAMEKIQNLVGAIEPTMVIVLSVVIGIILLSVLLPLAGIMNSIG